MSEVASLNLEASRFQVTQDAGSDINFSFTGTALNTTGYTWEFRVYNANSTGNDSDGGSAVATLTTVIAAGSGIVHTPGANSTVAITVGVIINAAARKGTSLWGELWRTDSGNVRKWSKGKLVLA